MGAETETGIDACVNHCQAIDILISFGASATTLNSFSHSPRILSGGAGVGSGALGVIDRILTDATIEEGLKWASAG